jgi:hypothetical protein
MKNYKTHVTEQKNDELISKSHLKIKIKMTYLRGIAN